jgi:hypothetical protein
LFGGWALRATVTMNDEHLHLLFQIERCRRLANEITDEAVRKSLCELADEYEAQLKPRGAGFMLQRRA